MRTPILKATSSLVLLAFVSGCAQAPLASRRLAAAAPAANNASPDDSAQGPAAPRPTVRVPISTSQFVRVAQPGDPDYVWQRPTHADGVTPIKGFKDYMVNQGWNHHDHETNLVKKGAKTVAGYGPEMLRFYAAVGAMEASKCIIEKDPTICTSYWASLTEGEQAIVGHVGFMAFMVGAGIPNVALFHLNPKFYLRMTNPQAAMAAGLKGPTLATQGIGWGLGQLGMMAGLMAQSIGTEIYFNPAWQEYKQAIKANPDPKFRSQKRAEVYAKIWADTAGSEKWRKSQYIEGAGMISAVLAAGATTRVLGWLWSGIKFAGKENAVSAISGTAAGMLLGYMSHTMLFLAYAGYFSEKYHEYFDHKQALADLTKAQDEFEAELKRVVSGAAPGPKQDPELKAVLDRFNKRVKRTTASLESPALSDFITEQPAAAPADAPSADLSALAAMLGGAQAGGPKADTRSELEKKADALEAAWDNFRGIMLTPIQMIQYRHADYLGKFDEKLMKLYYSYLWVAAGAQKDDKLWKEDQIEWKKGLDIGARINDFFCGNSIETSVVDSADWHGIPIPGKFDPQVKAPRVGSDLNLCVKDLKVPGSPDDIQKMRDDACKQDKKLCTDHDVWSHRLKSLDLPGHARQTYRELLQRKALLARDFSKDVDEVFAKVMEATNPVRDRVIKRYDLSIQKEMLHAMTGQKIAVKQGQPIDFDLASFKKNISGATSGDMSAGVLPAYESERAYWAGILAGNPAQMKFIQPHLEHLEAKQKAAEELLTYSLLKPEDRKVPAEDPAAQEQGGDMGAMMAQGNQEPYKAIIQMWKDFVLK